MSDDYGDLEVYRSLASDEAEVEVMLVANGDCREPNEAEIAGAAVAADNMRVSDGEDDDGDAVQVLLCDQKPGSGGMNYYLNREWEWPATADPNVSSTMPDDLGEGERSLQRQTSVAEIVEQDEGVEEILSRIQFNVDHAEMAETPWRQPGTNLQDYFNFNLDEKTFKENLLKQVRIRLEARQRRKIGVVNGHTSRN